MNKSVGMWKAEYLAYDVYCVNRSVFYPETGVTVIEHVRRDGGCIEAFSVDDAIAVTSRLNSDFLGLTPLPTTAT